MLLSIVIPTYNRAAFLDQTLSNLVPQLQDQVELVIMDGASEDNTSTIVENWTKKSNSIKYVKGLKNCGVDEDLAKAIGYARGRYCLLMSSDDYLVPDGIEIILRRLSKIDQSTAILLYSRINCNKSMKPISSQYWLKRGVSEYFVDGSKKESFGEYLKNAISIGAIFSYISCIVVLKSAWDEIKDSQVYYKTNYSHVYNLLNIIKNNYNLLYTKERLVLCRMNNDSFSAGGILNRYLIDFYGYTKIIDTVFSDNAKIKNLLYALVRREHGILRMMKIRVNCKSEDEWNEFKNIFKKFGYSNLKILISQNIYALRKIILFIILIRDKMVSMHD